MPHIDVLGKPDERKKKERKKERKKKEKTNKLLYFSNSLDFSTSPKGLHQGQPIIKKMPLHPKPSNISA